MTKRPAFFPLIGAMAVLSSSAIASEQTDDTRPTADKTVSITSPVLSDQEFRSQREFMIKDTTAKILVLRAAHDCAEAAKTSAAFAECNRQLREAILRKPEN
jgi:hypothetical protein